MGGGERAGTPAGAGAAGVAAAIAAVKARRGGRRLLLLSDFDGTLCEFQPTPEAVWLEPGRRRLLAALARRPGVTVGLVSGRRLDDLRRRARIDEPVYYAGLHGLEIVGNGGTTFVHERVAETRGLLQVLARALTAHLTALDGVRLENKQLSVAVHTRQASPDDRSEARRIVERIVGPHLDRSTFRLLPGSSVMEIMPNIAWTKGDAVRWIQADVERRYGPCWPVYLGDDVTDEDAFRAVGGDGLTIIVGARPSAAELRLPGPPAVEAWLRALSTFDL
jgi:trehalose-phosphatase